MHVTTLPKGHSDQHIALRGARRQAHLGGEVELELALLLQHGGVVVLVQNVHRDDAAFRGAPGRAALDVQLHEGARTAGRVAREAHVPVKVGLAPQVAVADLEELGPWDRQVAIPLMRILVSMGLAVSGVFRPKPEPFETLFKTQP